MPARRATLEKGVGVTSKEVVVSFRSDGYKVELTYNWILPWQLLGTVLEPPVLITFPVI